MKAIFLDRDGVIDEYPGDTKYVTAWNEFRFLPGAKEAIARLSKSGFQLFVISNQAGVGKGIFSQEALDSITKNMLRELEEADGKIEAVYYCVHSPDENCSCRKPKSGLIGIAKDNYPINIADSFFIGDTIRDILTAKTAGCKSILVLSGKEKLSNRQNWEAQPDFVFRDLAEAADFILNRK
ncbi:MAG: D-glycero-beta-D-manno-heptose 1,7-bisphosphate 7-phosphatase [Candidatus Omnitrophota bacterium]|jgi:histidinol-phosphate phosphatase family protein